MSKGKGQDWGRGVKLLSLLLALLLWGSVALERTGEMTLQVPVSAQYLPAGLCLVAPSPDKLAVTVSGPRILLCRLWFSGTSCGLDLSGAAAGTASVVPRESWFGLERELKVLRVSPAAVRVTLAESGRNNGVTP
jgi:hypothetical protein